MDIPWQIRVSENQQLAKVFELSGRAILGRQDKGEADPYWCAPDGDGYRVVLAPREEDVVSRHHVEVEPRRDRTFQITNLSRSQSIRFEDETILGRDASHSVTERAGFYLGKRLFVRVQFADAQSL